MQAAKNKASRLGSLQKVTVNDFFSVKLTWNNCFQQQGRIKQKPKEKGSHKKQ